MMPLDRARDALRQGGTLLHDAAGDWAVWRDGRFVAGVSPDLAPALIADRTLRLRPARDHLPGFPPECSQTWRVRAAPERPMTALAPIEREILHFHLFAGLGGGARGFNAAQVRLGPLRARYRCLGGIDNDPAAIRDFARLAGVPGTCRDLFDRAQYAQFHGCEPGPDWQEATPDDIRQAAGGERPHIVFLSAPCKGFSGLLSEARSGGARYQALNRLTLRGVWLMLEAWAGDPPELVLFENVPRILTRGRVLLDQIGELLRHYGYAVAETTHDCGRLGGLAQSRKRFLLVARHRARVPPFLYEPPQRRLRGVGEVLDRLPLPGDPIGGPMHRVPSLQWRTWVRLAFVEAGADWRSLNKLRVADGVLADYGVAPETDWQHGVLGVRRWDQLSGVVTGRGSPTTGAFAVADPRRAQGLGEFGQYGVKAWDETSQAVTGKAAVGAGGFAVADPRHGGPPKHCNEFRIVTWDDASRAVTSAHGSGQFVADPRAPDGAHTSKYRVTRGDEPSGAVIAASTTGQGAFAVADPRHADDDRPGAGVRRWDQPMGTITGQRSPLQGAFSVADPRPSNNRQFDNIYQVGRWDDPSRTVIGRTQPSDGAMSVADPRPADNPAEAAPAYKKIGHFGVVAWQDTSSAVLGAGRHDNGRWSVADPRGIPVPEDRLVCRIRALDGTWHRPFTTLELAALQSLVDPDEQLELDGLSDAAWRERIGNAVPPSAAQAIAETMGRTLLLAWSGEGFALSNVPIWVRPVAVALSVVDQSA